MTKEQHNDRCKLFDVCCDCGTQEYMIVARGCGFWHSQGDEILCDRCFDIREGGDGESHYIRRDQI